ncbi:MAG: hypothetical protein AMXMBFR82_03480 [Candidatus Hydrogenedentota bacterium]
MRIISILTLCFVGFAAGAAERPDLTGTIYDETEKPYEGAMVSIYTAKPRTGTGIVCPSCYLDCAKRSTTGEDGSFEVKALDPSLLFRVLVIAEGYTPMFVDNVDPLTGPIRVKLVKQDPSRNEPGHVLRGKVLDPNGKPVAGAKIEPYAMHYGTTNQYGGLDGVDPLSATNAKGEFAVTSEKPDLVLSVKVEARGLAAQNFTRLAAGDDVHELTMGYGATVSGRIEKGGEPVPGVVIGIVQTDRSSESFLGEIEVATDDQGRFTFANVPPNDEYAVYGQLADASSVGAVPVKVVRTESDGSLLDAGVLSVEPGHSVSGQVVLSDGGALPRDVRMMISRELAWDWLEVPVDESGHFEAHNLPSEEYTIGCRIPDYHLSPKNYSLDPLNKFSLMGRIDADIADLTLLFEPGKFEWQQAPQEASTRYTELKSEPIQGADWPER